jgi:hypothetical protein
LVGILDRRFASGGGLVKAEGDHCGRVGGDFKNANPRDAGQAVATFRITLAQQPASPERASVSP